MTGTAHEEVAKRARGRGGEARTRQSLPGPSGTKREVWVPTGLQAQDSCQAAWELSVDGEVGAESRCREGWREDKAAKQNAGETAHLLDFLYLASICPPAVHTEHMRSQILELTMEQSVGMWTWRAAATPRGPYDTPGPSCGQSGVWPSQGD